MGDEDRGHELPQRLPGAPGAAPHPPGSPSAPLLSTELWQRLAAAVTAERSGAAAREQDSPPARQPPLRSGPGSASTGPDERPHPTAPLSTYAPPTPGPSPRTRSPSGSGPPGGPRPPLRRRQEARRRPPPDLAPAAEPRSAEPGSAEPGPDHPGPVGWLGAGIAALVVIPALVIGSLAGVAVRHLAGPRGSAPSSAAAARQEAVRGEAAAWITQQVSPGAAVSCDQVMCAALKARGLPARDLLVLGPLSSDPRRSVVVVETAAVRALFGTSLDLAWAPAVLASFGSGSAGITVRVVASHGAVAYQTALAGDLAARKAAGSRLLADQRISVPAAARAQLTAGLVDLRLLSALTGLSRQLPVSLVDFGNVGPGASAGVPFRFADLSQTSQVGEARTHLNGLNSMVRPVRTVPAVLPDGRAVLRVEFAAPSPLAVSATPGSL